MELDQCPACRDVIREIMRALDERSQELEKQRQWLEQQKERSERLEQTAEQLRWRSVFEKTQLEKKNLKLGQELRKQAHKKEAFEAKNKVLEAQLGDMKRKLRSLQS